MTTPDFDSRRSAVYSRHGMVASSQPLATHAGLQALQAGGTAADAAIATAAALNVTEPGSTGLGGDAFVLYYEAHSQTVHALNGSGRAPAGLTLDALREVGITVEMPPFSVHTVTVPGAAAAWCDLQERFGKLGLGMVLQPAIDLAEEGFPVAPLTAVFWQRGAERQLSQAAGGEELMIDGRGPHAGEIFRNPGLAAVLRALAEGGKTAYYEGWIAERIVERVQGEGGHMTLADLAGHASTWEEPATTPYAGMHIHECPPNGQGITALIALNILSHFDLPEDPLSAERLHLVIEALRLAFADARWYIADPALSAVPVEELLSMGYARERAALIDPQRATVDQQRGAPAAGSDTVQFVVVDGEGNAASMVNSNYMGFGTGLVPEGTGFSLQNRGHGFSLNPEHPNALGPGKRPYHTIIPGMATHPDGTLYGPFGVMGGFMQPQGHVQVILGLLMDGLDPQQALDRPRVAIEDGTAGGGIAVEAGIPDGVMAQLAEMGHTVRRVEGYGRALFGRGQIIVRDRTTGVLAGGSDPRADGLAMGY